MDKDNNKRKAQRIEISLEIKIRLLDEAEEMKVNIKDISTTGARCIIPGRSVKVNAPIEIEIRIYERYIKCKGRIAWVLALRPGLGNINVFDVGIEFTEMNQEDREFLEKLLRR